MPTIIGKTGALYFLRKETNKNIGSPIETMADTAIKIIDKNETCITYSPCHIYNWFFHLRQERPT
jgi:hypothetical protein